tara:strand:+ start:40 stop:1233 length:1194 start_codon:yes stop_codon:yes gene_type:complete
MSYHSFNIGIIGAGIGGLALSIMLKDSGFSVTVFESSKHISTFGSGVQLSPNGLKVLRNLGVEEKLKKLATHPERIVISNAENNKVVSVIPLGDIASKRYSASFLQIHRSDLVDVLYEKACEKGVHFQFGRKAFVKSTNSVSSVISCGTHDFSFNVAVAADGVHSSTRNTFFKFASPSFLKQVAYRATVSLNDLDDIWRIPEVKIFLAPGSHVVMYPLIKRSLLNIIICTAEETWSLDGWSHAADPTEVSEKLKPFKSVRFLLDKLVSVHKWGLLGYESKCDWNCASLALLGDACHPMLPYLAQGANQALEDVAALSYFMSQKSEKGFPKSLEFYSKNRRGRVLEVQRAAQKNARFYHLPNGAVRILSHSALNLASRTIPSLLLSRFDWLYSYQLRH